MNKSADAPTLEWFRSLAAIADALNALESQCIAMGHGMVADKLRLAKTEIAAAAEIIQSQAYSKLEAEVLSEETKDATKH